MENVKVGKIGGNHNTRLAVVMMVAALLRCLPAQFCLLALF